MSCGAACLLAIVALLAGPQSVRAAAPRVQAEAPAPEPVVVYRLWSKSELVDAAAIHASKQDKGAREHLLYLDCSEFAPADRAQALGALSLALHSLSHNDVITPPAEVPGTQGALACCDLRTLRAVGDKKGLAQLRRALDRLGELGSGAAPEPEPKYHAVSEAAVEVEEEVEVEGYRDETYYRDVGYPDGYGGTHYRREQYVRRVRTTATRTVKKSVKKSVVALAPHLNKATAIGLAELTGTAFFAFEGRWFLSYALDEPRYHELLGLDDSEKSYLKLAFADEALAEKAGAQAREIVLFSGVSGLPRFVERTPTLAKKGQGSYQKTRDFLSLKRGRNDPFKDLLKKDADANEVIASLPNGLTFYGLFDGAGGRIDEANGNVAQMRARNRPRNKLIRSGWRCLECHNKQGGWLDADAAVKDLTAKRVTLLADAFDREGRRQRGETIRQKYLDPDGQYFDLLPRDRQVVETATKRASGMTAKQAGRVLVGAAVDYLERPVTLGTLARELGYPADEVRDALQAKGIDPVFVIIRAGGKGPRALVDAGFAQAAAVLYQTHRR